MVKRLKNPVFLIAIAGLVYQIINRILKQYGYDLIDYDLYKMIVDVISYIALGVGVYSTYQPKESVNNESK